jgi:hypothetical protein
MALLWKRTAARADPLKLSGEVLVVILCCLTGLYFRDGRGGDNTLLLREGWLKADERWLNGVRKRTKRGRNASIKYETLRISGDFSGEDFQNTGTFIVERSSVFATSSAQKTHLARDAYNAYPRMAGRCQAPFMQCSYITGCFGAKACYGYNYLAGCNRLVIFFAGSIEKTVLACGSATRMFFPWRVMPTGFLKGSPVSHFSVFPSAVTFQSALS